MEIPPITDEMGQYWGQPALIAITFYRDKALMTKRIFDELKEYSSSMPSGVYEGKMWRAREKVVRDGKLCYTDRWLLRWYGFSKDPNMVSNNQVFIEICDLEMGAAE